MKNFRVLLTTFLLLLFFSCKEKIKEERTEVEEKKLTKKIELGEETVKLSGINIEKVKKRKFSDFIKLTGEVSFNPKKLFNVATYFSGIVRESYVSEGDRVKKGERLVSIFSKEFLSAQSDYILIFKRFKRAEEKKDDEEIKLSMQMLNSAKEKLKIFGLEDEDIKLLSEREEISPLLYIKSPINGTVIESNVISGETFSEGTTLFKIADIENLWINVNIYEKDLSKVEEGSYVMIKIPSFLEKRFEGKLEIIGNIVDRETRTVKGRIAVFDKTGTLKPGMFVEVYIKNKEGIEILSIPESSVVKMGGKEYVFVLVGENTFELREVELGRTFEEFREILSGLREGEKIAGEGSFILKSHVMKGKMEVD